MAAIGPRGITSAASPSRTPTQPQGARPPTIGSSTRIASAVTAAAVHPSGGSAAPAIGTSSTAVSAVTFQPLVRAGAAESVACLRTGPTKRA